MSKPWPPNGRLSQWILEQFEPGYRGWAIDVGASDGVSVNTTWALEKSHRWTVVSVEANPEFAARLKAERGRVAMCACGAQPADSVTFFVHEQNPEAFSALRPQVKPDLHPSADMTWKRVRVPLQTVDQLLARWEFPTLDALCLDVEGGELDVLKGCDLDRWRPRVVVVESWEDVGPADVYLAARGYDRVARNVHNNLHLRRPDE